MPGKDAVVCGVVGLKVLRDEKLFQKPDLLETVIYPLDWCRLGQTENQAFLRLHKRMCVMRKQLISDSGLFVSTSGGKRRTSNLCYLHCRQSLNPRVRSSWDLWLHTTHLVCPEPSQPLLVRCGPGSPKPPLSHLYLSNTGKHIMPHKQISTKHWSQGRDRRNQLLWKALLLFCDHEKRLPFPEVHFSLWLNLPITSACACNSMTTTKDVCAATRFQTTINRVSRQSSYARHAYVLSSLESAAVSGHGILRWQH